MVWEGKGKEGYLRFFGLSLVGCLALVYIDWKLGP